MQSQKLPTSTNLPEKWQPKYLIKRIEDEDITISEDARNKILATLEQGARFIFVKDHVLMLNSIKSIDPLWRNNIPPKPKEVMEYEGSGSIVKARVSNQQEIDEWSKYFGNKLIEAWESK